MKFTILPADEVIEYVKKYVVKSKDAFRRKNAKLLIDRLENKDLGLIAYHGFVNEYGERYIICGFDLSRWWWAGDESDWEFAKSFYEDAFVNEILEAARVGITPDKLAT